MDVLRSKDRFEASEYIVTGYVERNGDAISSYEIRVPKDVVDYDLVGERADKIMECLERGAQEIAAALDLLRTK